MTPKIRSTSSKFAALFDCNTHGRFCVLCVIFASIALAHGLHVASELGSNMKSLSDSTNDILDRVNSLEKYSIKQSSVPATGTPTLAPPLKQESQSINILPNIPTANPYRYHAPINEKIIGSGNPVDSATPSPVPSPVTATDNPEDDPS